MNTTIEIPQYIDADWEQTMPQLQQFVKETITQFSTLKQFMEQQYIERTAQHQLANELQSIRNKQNEILQNQEKLLFQTGQKVNYVDELLDQFKIKQEHINQSMKEKIDEVDELLNNKLKQTQQICNQQINSFQEQLQVKQDSLSNLNNQFKQQNDQSSELGQMFRDQIQSFYQKQANYSEQIENIRKEISQTETEIKDIGKNINLKLLDVEENFFVSIIQRIMQCETNVNKYSGNIDYLIGKAADNEIRHKSLSQQVKEFQDQFQSIGQFNIQIQNQHDQLNNDQKESIKSMEIIKTRIGQIRQYFEDQLNKEIQERAEFQMDVDQKINYCLAQLSALEEDMTRKINFCNDVVTSSGLNEKYQMAKQQKYQSELEKLLEQDALQLGQYKFVNAVVLRIQELENIMLAHIAEEEAM